MQQQGPRRQSIRVGAGEEGQGVGSPSPVVTHGLQERCVWGGGEKG